MRLSERLYRWFVRLYPAGFRDEYAAPLQRQFRDDATEVRGAWGWLTFWTHTLLDLARTAPAARAREVIQDSRHTLRLWRARPVHTGFAIAVMALAIGVATGIFSVLNTLLLQSLPFRQPEQLAMMRMYLPGGLGDPQPFHEWRQSNAYASDALMYTTGDMNIEGANTFARSRLTETSWNFFDVLGVQPRLGRMFVAGEDGPGAPPMAVISHGLWQQFFGAAPSAIGATIRVNGTPMTIVGVAPPGFDYPQRTSIWSSTCFDMKNVPRTGVRFWESVIRIRDGMTLTEARTAFENEAFAERPERRKLDPAMRPALVPLREHLAGPVREASTVLLAGVGLLLMLACANIANFLLARTLSRSEELSIRVVLGASRARLVQQLLTETVLLSTGAAVIGLMVGAWVTSAAMSYQPTQLATQIYSILDWQVLAFALALALTTGVVFGVGPVLVISRLGSGSTRTMTASRGQTLVRQALITAQIALTIVLLTGSVVLGRTFLRLVATDNGFDVDAVATVSVSFAGTSYAGPTALAYYDRAVEAVRAVPGVTSASATQFLPLGGDSYGGAMFNVDGQGPETLVTLVPVGDAYFRTLGNELLAGREYLREDLSGSEPVIIVNEPLARLFGEPASAVGRMLTSSRLGKSRIIGVVRGMRDAGPTYLPQPQAYWPARNPKSLTFVVRTSGPARERIAVIRDALASVDPNVLVFDVKSMSDRLEQTLSRPKFYATAVAFFGGLALLLSILGVYGVVSYACGQRLRELGIRLALGTTSGRLRGSMLWKSALTVMLGAAIGIAGAAAAGRSLGALIRGADTSVMPMAAAVVAVTLAISALATWVATRRITHIDIVEVLRPDGSG